MTSNNQAFKFKNPHVIQKPANGDPKLPFAQKASPSNFSIASNSRSFVVLQQNQQVELLKSDLASPTQKQSSGSLATLGLKSSHSAVSLVESSNSNKSLIAPSTPNSSKQTAADVQKRSAAQASDTSIFKAPLPVKKSTSTNPELAKSQLHKNKSDRVHSPLEKLRSSKNADRSKSPIDSVSNASSSSDLKRSRTLDEDSFGLSRFSKTLKQEQSPKPIYDLAIDVLRTPSPVSENAPVRHDELLLKLQDIKDIYIASQTNYESKIDIIQKEKQAEKRKVKSLQDRIDRYENASFTLAESLELHRNLLAVSSNQYFWLIRLKQLKESRDQGLVSYY